MTPPAYQSYRDNLNKEQLNKAIALTNKLCATSNNCTYFNLLDDSRFVAGDYYDADHLSEIGAKKLSIFLDKIVIEKQSNKILTG